MRFLLYLLTAAATLCAQPVISNVEVVVSHGTFRIVFQTSDLGAPRNAWIDYGTSAALGSSTPHARGDAAATAGTRSIIESGLTPATLYYFRPVAVGPSGTSNWSCTEGGLGWTCDTSTGLGLLTTEDAPQEHPAPPIQIAPLDTTMPAINGQTFDVSVDDQKQCTNFQQQLQACAAADTSLNHLITIPAGASCVGRFILPAKIGTGNCVVRTSTPDSQLPPEGVRIDPTYVPRMASIVAPARLTGQAGGRSSVDTVACNQPVCTQGWRFVGIQFAAENLAAAKPQTVAIANVGSDGTITTVSPHQFSTNDQIYVSGVEGFDARGPNGVFRATATNPSTLKLLWTYLVPTFTCAQPPCYKPGTGRVSRAYGAQIIAASNTNPIILRTVEPHGLPSYPAQPILSAANGKLLLNPGHGIPSGSYTVRIEGSSNPEWNGYWMIANTNETTATLTNGPKSSCDTDCGTVRFKEVLQVSGAEGNTAANGASYFTVVNDTDIQLDDRAGNGDYTAGGAAALDPDLYFTILNFGSTSDRIVIDRSFINGGGFPNRVLYAITFHSTNSAVIDSHFDSITGWRTVDPVTKYIPAGFAGLFLGTSVALEMTNGSNKKIHNNYIGAAGISLFVQEGNGNVPENLQITRNRFYSDPKYMAGSPASDGRYYPKRHLLEFKRGARVLLDGNILDGNWADFTPCGPALALSIRGGGKRDNVTSDFTITNNIFRNTSSAIQIVGQDSNLPAVNQFTRRISIRNNLFYDIDNRVWQARPSQTGQSSFCGYAVSQLWPVEDLVIRNNTAETRGSYPQFFGYSYGRSEGVVVKDNVFTHNSDGNSGAIPPATALNVTGMAPTISGTPEQGWKQYFRAGSEFSGNVVVPGVRNSGNSANFSLTAPNANFTKSDCERYYAGFLDITCADGQSALDRLNAIFENIGNKNFHIREFQGKGADINAIERAVGVARAVAAGATSSTEASISYFSAAADPCAVDYTDNPEGDCERVVDSGTEGLRTVALLNLRPATNYFYRVQCPAEQLTGKIETLP